MKELRSNNEPKYAFTGRWLKLDNVILLNFYCKTCKHMFGGVQFKMGRIKIECWKCNIKRVLSQEK